MMFIRHFYFIIFVLIGFYPSFTFAQSSTDSLLQVYKSLSDVKKQDSTSIILLQDIGRIIIYSNPDSALFFFQQALELANQYEKTYYQADIHRDIGIIKYVKGDYLDALEEYTVADSLFRLTKNRYGEMKISNSLGLIHAVWEDRATALSYYNKGVRIANELNDTAYKTLLLYNIGITYMADKQIDSAFVMFKRTLTLAETHKNTLLIMQSNLMLGEASRIKHKNLDALAFLQKSEQLITDDNLWDKGYMYGTFSGVYEQIGNTTKAIEYGEKALEIETKINAKWELLRVHKILASAFEKAGDLKESIAHFRKYDAYRDSLFDSQKQQTITRLGLALKNLENERLYHENIEQQQKLDNQNLWIVFLAIFLSGLTITILVFIRINAERKKLNEALYLKNQDLDKLNELKNEILSIIGHDMINMTASLGGFINMFNLKEISASQFASIAPALEENIERVRLSFNNLFRWAESQKSEFTFNSEEIKPNVIIQDVLNLFTAIANRREISLLKSCDSDVSCIFDEYHLVLILRNLVHNALKFTYDGSSVEVYARKETNNTIRIGVKDSGMGMPESIRQQLLSDTGKRFSKVGARNEGGTGLGLIASKRFLNLNGTSLNIDSEEGKGSDFYFYVMSSDSNSVNS